MAGTYFGGKGGSFGGRGGAFGGKVAVAKGFANPWYSFYVEFAVDFFL